MSYLLTPLPGGNYKAYLYDCDGTIADTMPAHYKAWCEALRPWSCPFSENLFGELAGIPLVQTVEILNQRFNLKMPLLDVAQQKEAAFWRNANEILPIVPVVEHIRAHQGLVPLAVVSGGGRESVLEILTRLGLQDCFNAIICAGDYARGKPAPEPFLLGASRLGVAPSDCLVFEDADQGIRAAEAAGMKWVQVMRA
ncbi:HAD family phosphatase [Bdellovibrionota bacterium FG-2]